MVLAWSEVTWVVEHAPEGAGWKLGGWCSRAGGMVEVGGGGRWRRKVAFALEDTRVIKLTRLSACQMGKVREVYRMNG